MAWTALSWHLSWLSDLLEHEIKRVMPTRCILCGLLSSLVKLLNKSIEGTADDEDEGVTPDVAIRSGLELLKVRPPLLHAASVVPDNTIPLGTSNHGPQGPTAVFHSLPGSQV